MSTMKWHGYPLGAIEADTITLKVVRKSGNLYAITHNNISNVHPKVKACEVDGDRIEYEAGVYPIRWDLDTHEIAELITSFDSDRLMTVYA